MARTPVDSSQACWAVDLTHEKPVWRKIDCREGPPDRIAHAQAVSSDNIVYVFGGRAGITMSEQAMSDLWMLDCSGEPGSEVWSEIVPDLENGDPIPKARSFHRMVCIGHSLYVFGGCGTTLGRMADLHRFDLSTKTWHSLGKSQLRGRGGPNLLVLNSGTKLGVIAGFAGEETNDGHRYDMKSGWEPSLMGADIEGLRPRSVCIAESFPSVGVAIVFGGEVDPSAKGHEGAGGFANDLVVLDEKTGALRETVACPTNEPWPGQRGWSDSSALDDGSGNGLLYVYGGLTGDDNSPIRLDDLWRLEITADA